MLDEGSNELVGELLDSPVAGVDSMSMPCRHDWLLMQFTAGVIMGADSTGRPVFVPTGDTESAYGCARCDEPWRPS